MIRDIIRELNPGIKTPLLTTFLGPTTARVESLGKIRPEFKGHNLITIALGPGDARIFYKGMDIMMDAFLQARKTIPQLTYTIIGDWSEADIKKLTEKFSAEDRKSIFFLGHQSDIDVYLKNSDLGVHIARGDAFPTSTIETMHAGIPIIVSEYTGTKQIVKKINPELVIALSADELAKKIKWFFSLTLSEKTDLSARVKQVAGEYTETSAREHYRKTFAVLNK